MKTATPFKDRKGNTIYSGDFCRTWIPDENNKPNLGSWIFEEVRFYKNDWFLFDIHFDYENSKEEPVLDIPAIQCHLFR